MSEPFLGQIITFPYTFAPRGYALCNGQLLPIQQNTALFSLLGTTYGGNGQTNFAFPNLQGRVPIHVGGTIGQGPGLSPYDLGQSGGEEAHALTTTELPSHTHTVAPLASDDERTTDRPGNAYPAMGGVYASTNDSNAPMGSSFTAAAGQSLPHDNLQPYLVLNYAIAISGVFPARS